MGKGCKGLGVSDEVVEKRKTMLVYQYLDLSKEGSIGVFFLWSKLLVDELKGYR